MNLALTAFVAGAIAVTRLSTLPSGMMLAAAGLCAAAVCALPWMKGWRAASAVSLWLGVTYASVFGHIGLAQRLPTALAGTDLHLVGTIASLPDRTGRLTRFRFRPGDCGDCWTRSTIALSVYDPAFQARVGERWALTVRLERPRGSVNPGLFDYDGWLLAEGIAARGYVRSDPAPVRIAAAGWRSGLQGFRDDLRKFVQTAIGDEEIRGLIIALTIGESSAIGSDNWRTLSATGTNHLLIISGLHVGLVAGASFKLARWLGFSYPLAGTLSLALAGAYGAVAGMGLPVQRSLVMTAVVLGGVILNRYFTPSSMLCIALAAVVLINPFATLASGFWLSFGAVFALLFAFGARISIGQDRARDRAMDLLHSQWIVFVGTVPLLAVTVSQLSMVSMLANLIAIPWVSVLVIPPLLVAVLCLPLSTTIAGTVMTMASYSLAGVWQVISWFASLDVVLFFAALSPMAVALALMGTALMLSPAGMLPRWPGIVMWLPLMAPPPVPANAMEVRVIDVGQGLAVLVRTPEETLLYDAGPKFGDRFDAGERIVLPMLRQLGIGRHLDSFVISHLDIDHAGGAEAIERVLSIGRSHTGDDGSRCPKRKSWQTGETVVVMQPVALEGSDNDRSCVVWVTWRDFTVLLPGDIERAGERRLAQLAIPDVDVLVVPHHGSRSSSTPLFLNHVVREGRGIAVVSAGYRNRFGHPDDAVLDRYRHRGISVFNTATSGAVLIRLRPGTRASVEEARREYHRFWYD